MKKIELLQKKHRRDKFDCEHENLTNYLVKYVGQDIKKNLSSCHVLPDDDDNVIGYYTLTNESVSKDLVPEWEKKIPYPRIPVTLLGRLAIDKNYKDKGFGRYLLSDALLRAAELSIEMGSVGVITDPIDVKAENFYLYFGFTKFSNGRMFLPMKTIIKVFRTEIA